jgi:SOS response regulatory protein OraA/RecX
MSIANMTKAELRGRLEREIEKTKELEQIINRVNTILMNAGIQKHRVNVRYRREISRIESPTKQGQSRVRRTG